MGPMVMACRALRGLFGLNLHSVLLHDRLVASSLGFIPSLQESLRENLTLLLHLSQNQLPFFRPHDVPIERIVDVQPRLYRWFYPSPAIAARFRDERDREQTLIFTSLRPLRDHHFGAPFETGSARWPSAWLWLPIVLGTVCAIPLARLISFDLGAAVFFALLLVNNLLHPRWGTIKPAVPPDVHRSHAG